MASPWLGVASVDACDPYTSCFVHRRSRPDGPGASRRRGGVRAAAHPLPVPHRCGRLDRDGQLGHRPLALERAREVRRAGRGVLHCACSDRHEDEHHGQRGRAVSMARAASGPPRGGARYCYRVEFGTATPVIDLLGADPSPSFRRSYPLAPPSRSPLRCSATGARPGRRGRRRQQAGRSDGAAGTERRALCRRYGRHRLSLRNPDQLRRPSPDGHERERRVRPQLWSRWARRSRSSPRPATMASTAPSCRSGRSRRAASSSSGRYAMETYCCVNGTNSASYPSAWYAFDAGNARFYVLEAAWSSRTTARRTSTRTITTPLDAASAEYQWLENDLRTHPSQLKFAFFHYPLYSSNATELSDTWLRGREQPRGPAGAQRRGHRVQRPRAHLHAQRQAE